MVEHFIGLPELVGGESQWGYRYGIRQFFDVFEVKRCTTRSAVEDFEGGDLIAVLLDELAEAGHHLTRLLFCLDIPTGGDEIVLTDDIQGLLVALLRFQESGTQVGVVERNSCLSDEPFGDDFDCWIVRGEVELACFLLCYL